MTSRVGLSNESVGEDPFVQQPERPPGTSLSATAISEGSPTVIQSYFPSATTLSLAYEESASG